MAAKTNTKKLSTCINSSATAVGAKIKSRYSAADFISPNISLNDDLQKSPIISYQQQRPDVTNIIITGTTIITKLTIDNQTVRFISNNFHIFHNCKENGDYNNLIDKCYTS